MSTSTGARKAEAAKPPARRPGPGVVTLVIAVAVVVVGVVAAALLVRPGGGEAVDERPLVGTGAAATDDVMTALAQDIPELGSWPVDTAGTIVTKDPARNDSCRITVPTDDAQGITALVTQQRAAADRPPCLDFARSSVDSSGSPDLAGADLTYIPFAVDAVTFTQRADSPNPRSLTVEQLRQIYECTAPAGTHLPQLPVFGSGLRATFLDAIGLADAADFTTVHPCVTDFGDRVYETSGRALADPRGIAPISVAQYLAQSSGVIADERGAAGSLGQVDGVAPLVATPDAIGLAYRPDSLNPRTLSVEDLRTVYSCALPPAAQQRFAPLLPAPGSAVRGAFLTAIGLTDSPDFTAANSCVSDTDAAGAPLAENVGTSLTDPRHIVPYSVQQHLAQLNGTVEDVHGATLLAPVGDTAPAGPNPAFPLVHDVYTVVPTARLAEEPLASVFVGSGSRVCASTGTITRHGFALAPNCGETSLRTGTG